MENVSQFRTSIENYSKNLIKELQSGGTEEFKKFLKFSSNFYKYSLNNRILIQLQMPNSTKVASFLKWKELGRNVKKGEKAIRILAPIMKKTQELSNDGKMEEKISGIWFKTVPVFDISQTEGEDVPTWQIRPSLENDDDKGLYALLKKKAEDQNIIVSEKELNGPMGVSYGGRVDIETKQGQVSKFLTLIHEIAHEILHKGSESKMLSKNDKECQAESTAYIVASHFGLENVVSAEYLIHWGNSEKEFSKNLSSTIKASEEILEMLTENEKVNETINQTLVKVA